MTTSTFCTPNIGPGQRRLRLVFGVVMSAIAFGLAGVLFAEGAERALRLTVFLPLWAGAVGLLQARQNTCIALAAKGLRNMDSGPSPVTDLTELRQMREQARKVRLQSFAVAFVTTLLFVALPARRGSGRTLPQVALVRNGLSA